MNKTTHAILQILAILIQVSTAASGVVPAKYQPIVMSVVSCAQALLAILNHNGAAPTTPSAKAILLLVGATCFALPMRAQANTPSEPFNATSVTLNFATVSLPGVGQSIGGAETDLMISPTPNNMVGEATIINTAFDFVGGRYNRLFPQVSKALNNIAPNINFLDWQFGLTASVGVVRPIGVPPNNTHWGEGAGGFVNYAANGVVGLGIEAQYRKLPGYKNSTWSIALGPNFHF